MGFEKNRRITIFIARVWLIAVGRYVCDISGTQPICGSVHQSVKLRLAYSTCFIESTFMIELVRRAVSLESLLRRDYSSS